MVSRARTRRGLVLLSVLALGLALGAFLVASPWLAIELVQPSLGLAFAPFLTSAWLLGFALGAILVGRLRSWARPLLTTFGALAFGASLALPDFLGDARIADSLVLGPADFRVAVLVLLLLFGLSAGGMLPSYSRRANSLGPAFAVVFMGASLGAYFVVGEAALAFGREPTLVAAGGLGAVLCLLLAFAPTAYRRSGKSTPSLEALPIGGPMGLAPSTAPSPADARTPRPRLRPRHAGALGALIAPWSLLLFGLCLELGGLLLGGALGVDFATRLHLLTACFVGLGCGALLVPLLFQSDARGVSGLLLLLSAASAWLIKSDDLLALAHEHGLLHRVASLELRLGTGLALEQWAEVLIVILPPLFAMGAAIPVLATSLVRDEPGRRIGGILGMGAIGGTLCFALERLPVPAALGISVALAVLGVIFVEVAPGGGVGRVRNPFVRLAGRLARLTTLVALGLASIYISQQSAPHFGFHKLRALSFARFDFPVLADWKRAPAGAVATFAEALGPREVRWSPGGRTERPGSRLPYHLTQLLAKPGARVARLDQVESTWSGPDLSDGSIEVASPRSQWLGRNGWSWETHESGAQDFDLVWLGELRPSSPDHFQHTTSEALAIYRGALAPGGLVVGLLDPGHVTRRTLQAQLATFGEAFPWSAIWLVDGQVLLTGAESCPARLFPEVEDLDRILSRWIFQEGLGSEALVLGHFIGELGKDPKRELLTDGHPWALREPSALPKDLPRNLGLILGRATVPPSIWSVRDAAEAKVALLGARAKGQARIAKAWVDFYRKSAPASIAQATWEDRLADAMDHVQSLVPEDPEALALEREIGIAALRQEALSVLRKREPARAITPMLEATEMDPARADLYLLLTAAFRISRYEEPADAARRKLDILAPGWRKSELAKELFGLGYVPKP